MANMVDLLIKSIVALAIVKTAVGGLLPQNAISSNVEQSEIPFSSNEHSNDIVRNRRNAYYSPHQYYANYYNDYYNNYYNQLGYYNKPSRPVAVASTDRFDGNGNNIFDRDGNNNFVTPQGTKYVYRPIFQYKSTQQKRHKLFVPTIGV